MKNKRWMACLGGIALLVGCATYQPRPIDPSSVRKKWQERRLDDPALRTELAKRLPSREASQWPPPAYGRAELMAAALVLNPELAEARAQFAQALGAVTSAKALPNPTIGLALERFTQNQSGSSELGNAPWLWGISTDWLLDMGLQRELRKDIAQSGVRAARLDYAEKIWTVRQTLRTALADLLLGRRQQALARQTMQTAAALEEASAQRYAAGEAASTEQLQAALTLAQATRAESTAAQRVAEAQARLARAIGVPAAALEGVALRWDAFDQPAGPPADQWPRVMDQALLSRPDLERALVDYDIRETELHQQIRAQYPRVSLGPGYTYDHGVRKVSLGINTTLPIFDQNQGPIAEAEARRAAAGRHVEAVQATIQKEIDLASMQLTLANRSLETAHAERDASSRITRQVEVGRTLGAEDRVALLQAQLADLATAQTELTALDQSQQALGALEDALRMPVDGAEILLSTPPMGIER